MEELNNKINIDNLNRIPTIATRGVMVFPEQEILIEVGREKSLIAIDKSINDNDKYVYLVSQQEILDEDPLLTDLYGIGSVAEIIKVSQEDGYSQLTIKGLSRARHIRMEEAEDTIFSDVELLEDYIPNESEADDLVLMIARNFDEFINNFLKNHNLPEGTVERMTNYTSPANLSDYFAQILPMPYEERQELLETLNVNERLYALLENMSAETDKVSIDSDINKKVKDRIDESQKEYYLREKMRAIREELGDVSSGTDDIDDLRERVENNPYPESIKKKALDEIKRYEMVPPASGESGVIRNYLDWLLDVPWWQETTDNDDLKLVEQRLDEDHYGLEKVKERI